MLFKIFKTKNGYGDCLVRCGSLQVLLGIASAILSFVILGMDRGKYDILELENGNVTSVIIALDAGSLISSLAFILTGLVPFTCCSCMAVDEGAAVEFIRKKIKFMVASTVSASIFVPIVIGSVVATFFLRGKYGKEYLEVTGTLFIVALVQFTVSIVAAAYCCCGTPWKRCKLEKNYQNFALTENFQNEKDAFVVNGLDTGKEKE